MSQAVKQALNMFLEYDDFEEDDYIIDLGDAMIKSGNNKHSKNDVPTESIRRMVTDGY